ncbi:MAG TPA: alpha-glucan family phosphorylase [Actinomycetota bacterium]|nr:alpha-glucan family phosphorylase [Actinomycetota bacterium]
MKALRSFAVRAALPEELGVLMTIAMNLRWSWDAEAVDLFRWGDPEAWEAAGHDPVKMLGLVAPERFTELTEDGPFMGFLADVEESLTSYMEEPRWFQSKDEPALRTVAYFSPEFGVSEALPVYSGGLGVLAGDHLKAASDLGVPMVGVGLLYHQGYFKQRLNADGWQLEYYPQLDPHAMPLVLQTDDDGSPLRIDVDLAGIRCAAQIWLAQVGRVPLLLLDSDIEENDDEERRITDRLYGGGTEHRLRQEILLGIGGVRALRAAGFDPDVFHSNEGHAGFLGLERIRQLVMEEGLDFQSALEAVRATTVFTTHTPVPAGIDVYETELMERYFDAFAKECDVPLDDLLALGQSHSVPAVELEETFNMALLGFRVAGRANAVSKLHGVVSRTIFGDLWPEIPSNEVPIGAITNGVHTATWLGPEMSEILNRRLSPGWAEAGNARWERVREVTDAEIWRERERARERLVYFVRARLRQQLLARGVSEAETAWTEEVFDPGVLTVGFARRFAQYKRGSLLLADPERLRSLLLSGDRPIQFVFAGKAHPLDDGGKAMIQALVHFASDPELRNRFAFLEDYDMEVARVLCQGSDVWLNNPRRPLEACGTSGMKAAINGALNCSVLDGWWDEVYDGRNGWAIGTDDVYDDDEYQDRVEASALYDLLEREIAPRFYDRAEGPVPRRWVERIKASIASLGSFVSADRMVRDYVDTLYEPAARQATALSWEDFKGARDLAAWKSRLLDAWDDVQVLDVEGEQRPAEVGEERDVVARVRLGRLTTDDVLVQMVHGRVGANGELLEPAVTEMEPDGAEEGVSRYAGRFKTDKAGLYGYAVRVVPAHKDLNNPMYLGVLTWA